MKSSYKLLAALIVAAGVNFATTSSINAAEANKTITTQISQPLEMGGHKMKHHRMKKNHMNRGRHLGWSRGKHKGWR